MYVIGLHGPNLGLWTGFGPLKGHKIDLRGSQDDLRNKNENIYFYYKNYAYFIWLLPF